jgi:apolipoprotein N-acyltransferase
MPDGLKRSVLNISLALLSALLICLALPKANLWMLAWVCLVPLFFALAGARPLLAFFISYLFFGMPFLVIAFRFNLIESLYSLHHHLLIGIYMALHFGLFGAVFAFIAKRWRLEAALLAAPFLWVCFEYLRTNLSFLSMPWIFLSHTQYQHPVVFQFISITGAWGLSFLIVLVNAGIFALLSRYVPVSSPGWHVVKLTQRGRWAVAGIAAAALAGALSFGLATMGPPPAGKEIRISVIQANISQSIKWDRHYAKYILDTYEGLTEVAFFRDRPDLIVWPEAATPSGIDRDPVSYKRILEILSKTKTPLLLGTSHGRKYKDEAGTTQLKNTNSAVLFSKGIPPQKYDKNILFPLYEYIPYKEILPWHLVGAKRVFEYTPGETATVLHLFQTALGTPICWESGYPDLVRRFVYNGAQFIVNLTNEANFGDTDLPYHCLSVSVMRAAENHVYVVRCGNTGISCFIDPFGRVVDRVTDENGKDTFVQGILTGSVIPSSEKTIYTLLGEWFVLACFIVSGAFLVLAWRREAWK